MTTNVHFSKGTISEQYLYEDLVIEAIGIFGHDVFYLPRTLVNEDELLGEDPLSKFSDAYGIEMWMETQEGYEGEKDIVTRFGLDIQNETSFIVSRRRWDDVVSRNDNLIVNTRPDEGDLIYFPAIKRLWIISFVDHDDPFYQVNNLPVYKLYCRSWEYSSERLDTGISAIDAIETARSTDASGYEFSLENQIAFNENIGQEWGTIYDQSPAPNPWPPADIDIVLESATAAAESPTSGVNLLAETTTAGTSLLTEDSDAYYSFFIINEDYSLATVDPQSDNAFIDTQADLILDFTETNPFGEPTNSI